MARRGGDLRTRAPLTEDCGAAAPASERSGGTAGAEGGGDRPLPAPSRRGEVIRRTFPGSFSKLGAGLRESGGGLVNRVETSFLVPCCVPCLRAVNFPKEKRKET